MGPHDALFKAVFADPVHAAGALRSAVPPDLAAGIDWSQLRPCPGSFVDEQLRHRHTDLLFTAPLAGRSTLLYLLYEHESSVDRWMPLRLLRYQLRIWDDCLQQDPSLRALPPIVPVVLHHSDTGWTATTSFAELLDVPGELRGAFEPFLPRFRFVLDDVSEVPDERLRARAMSALGKLAFGGLKHGRSDDGRMEWLTEWAQVVQEVAKAPDGVRALAQVVRYLMLVNERVTPHDMERVLTAPLGREQTQEVVMTYGEMLIEKGRTEGRTEGRVEGRTEGRVEGRTEGRVEGQAKALLHLLDKRSLTTSEAQRQRIMNCRNMEELDRWMDRVLDVTHIEELFADD